MKGLQEHWVERKERGSPLPALKQLRDLGGEISVLFRMPPKKRREAPSEKSFAAHLIQLKVDEKLLKKAKEEETDELEEECSTSAATSIRLFMALDVFVNSDGISELVSEARLKWGDQYEDFVKERLSDVHAQLVKKYPLVSFNNRSVLFNFLVLVEFLSERVEEQESRLENDGVIFDYTGWQLPKKG